MLNIVKRQIKELLDTLIGAGTEVGAAIQGQNAAGLVNILADAQDAAVAIGSKIEAESLGEGDKLTEEERSRAGNVIGLMEKYCEFLWQITQTQDTQEQLRLRAEAWGLLEEAGGALERIPEQMTAVFLPYKASMWDCMESVWQAACKDPDWVPFVMPIPYFDLQDGKVSARHYEGDKFPSYVPVVDYNAFPLEELHPDAVFVHNPFDDCNIVTSVLPQYFSAELKKIAGRLIYIPYYITGDGVFVTHRYFPSYENMDYIVTQCERTIDSFASHLPREKFLPFGSPIADRVLRLEQEKPSIPEEWKAQLKNGMDFGGDRAVMLNTSISLLMKQRERFLDKIEYLFDLAKGKKGITLVWRPHPLLAASAQAMGEKYAARLRGLEEKFLGEKIGVLDTNPDVGVTVALCDAYLGETASSVIHMFGIAGKPRFYINLQVPDRNLAGDGWGGGGNPVYKKEEQPSGIGSPVYGNEEQPSGIGSPVYGNEEQPSGIGSPIYGNEEQLSDSGSLPDGGEKIPVTAWCRYGDREYYVWDEEGWLLEREVGAHKLTPLLRIPGRDVILGKAYSRMEVKGEDIWVYPENEAGIFLYHISSGRMWKIFQSSTDSDGNPDTLLLEVDDECVSIIRAEKFKRGNAAHVWPENDTNTLDDYFRFLQTAEDSELTGNVGVYATWLDNLDGSCGQKILQAVKDGISGKSSKQAG